MRICVNYDEDGDDYKPYGGCTGDPFRCFYFKPNRQYCPYMKDAGGFSEEKVADWWKWKNRQRGFFNDKTMTILSNLKNNLFGK
jgi:hypothetical protein